MTAAITMVEIEEGAAVDGVVARCERWSRRLPDDCEIPISQAETLELAEHIAHIEAPEPSWSRVLIWWEMIRGNRFAYRKHHVVVID